MKALEARLTADWRTLAAATGLRDADALGARLIAAYAEPHRRYHGLAHIAYLLDEIARREALLADASLLRLSAWFHDAIYDPLAKDNEALSAAWAARDLAAHGYASSATAAVEALILKTRSHHAGDASPDEALFLDMDFAILGAARPTYETYARSIRAEYAAAPAPAFRAGRAAFLKSVLAQPRMFRTALYEAMYGASARDNLAWELARLESGAPLDA